MFRGVLRLPIVPISPFRIILVSIFGPSDLYDAFRNRRSVGFSGMEDGKRKLEERKREKHEKRWIPGDNPVLLVPRQVPRLSILCVFPLSIIGAPLFRAMR